MSVVVAYKYAANPQDASVAADGTVDWSRAKAAVSDYDPVAAAVARKVADAEGTDVVGISVGNSSVASSLAKKNAMSRGFDRGVVVADDEVNDWNNTKIASALAGLVKQLGDVDIVLTGDSSVDNVSRMTSAIVAGYLGWPCFQEVTDVEKTGTGFKLTQRDAGGTRTVEVDGPVVVSTTSDAVVAPVPSMKDILAAGKKTVETVAPADASAADVTLEVTSRSKPETRARKNIVFTGDTAVADLVAALRADGVL